MKHFALVLIMAIFLTASSSQYIRNKLPKGQTNLREDGGLHYEANDEYGIYYSKADRMHSQRGGWAHDFIRIIWSCTFERFAIKFFKKINSWLIYPDALISKN